MIAKYGDSVSSCRHTRPRAFAGREPDPARERVAVLAGIGVPALLHEPDPDAARATVRSTRAGDGGTSYAVQQRGVAHDVPPGPAG